ncbi:MAG TPA: hypothetical protein VHU81_13770 [Thermoanaerobaculia bacterium]|jgi:hypothetical protein|nr:hypothetical protein [Thermoanaerobaculia bacterium]
MLQVELDIFSGRPNPSWILSDKEEKELIDRVHADTSIIAPVTAPAGGLGYRGYIVSEVKEGQSGKAKQLPSAFRIGGAIEKDKSTSLWLLDTSEREDTEVDEFLRDFTSQAIAAKPEARLQSEHDNLVSATDKGSLVACASNYFTSSTDFSFWNGATYIRKNNCYNFAANHRTNTFAQPGRATGAMYTAISCSNVGAATVHDGWANGCVASNNLTIALVIWPNTDFHFYRKCANGLWCHKPGQTAARNYDNSGNLITNVETANRGGYTSFCGYYYADNSTIVVS